MELKPLHIVNAQEQALSSQPVCWRFISKLLQW